MSGREEYMKIVVRKEKTIAHKTDALVLFYFEGAGLHSAAEELDGQCDGMLSRMIKAGDVKGTLYETAVAYTGGAIGAGRLIPVGLGKKEDFTRERLRGASAVGARKVRELHITEYTLLPSGAQSVLSLKDTVEAVIEGTLLGLYRFTPYKTKKDESKAIERVTLITDNSADLAVMKDAARASETICSAVYLVRDLVSTPSNEMTPTILAERARRLTNTAGFTLKIVEESAMRRMKMNALLGVSRGSAEPPKLIVMTYKGAPKALPPIVLVGKGITFDSGGISLKPSDRMDEMKDDMGGGAVVIAVLKAAADLELPVNLVGIVPAAENLPSGSALKPGDVLRSLSGQTIEIKNTDAEGRLILADALTYAQRFKPEAIIDIATLTGACVVALGDQIAGMLGTDDTVKDMLRRASETTGEALWELPLRQEYEELLKSDVADMKNTGTRYGGTITAALFLKKFVGDYPWVHLDIAGPVFITQDRPYIPKGATGIGVRLLVQFLKYWIERRNGSAS